MKTNQETTTYELTFHLMGEDTAPVRAMVEKHGGKVVSERQPQKVRLGYSIGKQQYSFMGTILFTAGGEVIAPLSNDLKLSGVALRFQIGRRVERKEPKRAPKAEQTPSEGAHAPSRIKPFDGTLSNEALEKKIEEILK